MKNGAFGRINEINGEKQPKIRGREFTDRPPKMAANLPIAFSGNKKDAHHWTPNFRCFSYLTMSSSANNGILPLSTRMNSGGKSECLFDQLLTTCLVTPQRVAKSLFAYRFNVILQRLILRFIFAVGLNEFKDAVECVGIVLV
jgi:hypothetical protein